jgi:hypothetical protein
MQVFESWFSDGPAPVLTLVEIHEGVTVDRFDMRHLLERSTTLSYVASGRQSRLDRIHDADRFRDLHNASEKVQNKRRKIEDVPVPVQTTIEQAPAPPAPVAYDPGTGFECPYDVPLGMMLPQNEKQHNVIVQTVNFVAQNGPNTAREIMRRQGDNPLFAFLNPNDALHECEIFFFFFFVFFCVLFF